MDIYRLTSFVRAYECRSFTEAARRTFVSRQALSKAISQLEAELGQLFDRRARGVRPTVLAEALYPHAKRVIDECDAIGQIAQRHADGRAGLVTLAVEANAAMTLPLGLTGAYAAARPDLTITATMLPGGLALEALGDGKADMVIAGPPYGAAGAAASGMAGGTGAEGLAGAAGPTEGELCYEPIGSGELVVVLSARAFGADRPSGPDGMGGPDGMDGPNGMGGMSGLAGGAEPEYAPELGVAALEGRTIYGVSPNNRVERLLVPYLEKNGVSAHLTYECTDTAVATSQMEAGLGGVLVEKTGARERFGDARYVHVPLRGEGAPGWEVGVTYRRGDLCAPVARDLASFARGFAASAKVRGA